MNLTCLLVGEKITTSSLPRISMAICYRVVVAAAEAAAAL